MYSDESDIELIERYVLNKLSSDELSTFYQRLKDDATFAEKTQDYKDIILAVKIDRPDNFKQVIAAWEAEIRKTEQISRNSLLSKQGIAHRVGKDPSHKQISLQPFWKKYAAMAAVVTLMIATIVYALTSQDKRNLQELFAAHFVHHEELLTNRGNDDHHTLTQALQAYNAKNYVEASQHFDVYLKHNPKHYGAWFYLGVSQLGAGNNNKALASFDSVIYRKAIFKDSAEWYKALTYLQMNDLAAARAQLKAIQVQHNHDYKGKAEELLEELEK